MEGARGMMRCTRVVWRALCATVRCTGVRARERHAVRRRRCAERYTEIERENRLLLQRMSALLHAGPTPEMTPAVRMLSGRGAGGDALLTLLLLSQSVRKSHSLNEKSRRQELIRITQENQVR